MEYQLQAFLGRQPAQDDLLCAVYSLTNVAAQLAGGDPIPPDAMLDLAMMTFPFGMGNATRHVQLHEPNYYRGDGLVGMTEFANDDLLADDSLLGSDTRSCTGSHHPSLECFATGTPDGYTEEAEDSPRHSQDRTPTPIPVPALGDGGPVQPPLPFNRGEGTGNRLASGGQASSLTRKS